MHNKTTLKKDVYAYPVDEARFWDKVDRKEQDQCWEWLGGVNTTGYGMAHVRNRPEEYERTGKTFTQLPAHRVALSLTRHVNQADYVMHSCDNRKCCNPSHLRTSTAQDNYNDMLAKGRAAYQKKRGENQ